MVQLLWKTAVQQFLKKSKKQLPCDAAIPFLGIDPKELKEGTGTDICIPKFVIALFTVATSNPSVHQSICPKCGMYIQWNMICLKKEGNSDTCYNMDEPRRHYAK